MNSKWWEIFPRITIIVVVVVVVNTKHFNAKTKRIIYHLIKIEQTNNNNDNRSVANKSDILTLDVWIMVLNGNSKYRIKIRISIDSKNKRRFESIYLRSVVRSFAVVFALVFFFSSLFFVRFLLPFFHHSSAGLSSLQFFLLRCAAKYRTIRAINVTLASTVFCIRSITYRTTTEIIKTATKFLCATLFTFNTLHQFSKATQRKYAEFSVVSSLAPQDIVDVEN